MKHFWDIQNSPIFALFLCIFTNLFLVLLRKKDFLRLLLCIFSNRQKSAGSRPNAAGSIQAGFRQLVNSMHRQAFQPAKVMYQLLPVLLLYRTQRLLSARLVPPGASRQTPHAAVLLFLQSKSQPSGLQQPSLLPTSSILHSFRLPTTQILLSPATSHKKTEPKAQFFPLYISSTFPGLCNP